MFDVFYIGTKPGLFAHEQPCDSIHHARSRSRTRYCWIVTYLADYSDWDFLWEPPPWQSHQRHAWASQWQKDSGTYLVPRQGFQDTNYHASPVINRLAERSLWQIPADIADTFDYSWHPDPTDPPMTYQFGTQWQKTNGPRYVNGGDTAKYVAEPRCIRTKIDPDWNIPDGIDLDSFDWTWHPDATDQPFIYQFGTQWQKTHGPRYMVPGGNTVKYVTEPRCVRTKIDPNWHKPDGVDIDTFDWTWHPDATDQPFIYQFGTQHQRTGGPRYVLPNATDVKYVDQIRIKTQRVATTIIEIDHLDGNAGQIPLVSKTSRYFDNYLDTLRRIAKGINDEHEFVWICSSICDYRAFDFSWHPEQWQATMLHVFASDGQKFGDTFFMHVPSFLSRSDTCQLLEWYDINFVDSVDVPRRPMPMIRHQEDCHVDKVRTQSWTGPLALFSNNDSITETNVTVPLWREQTKTVVPLSEGASAVIVPRTAVPYIKTQLYDYPYIDRTHRVFRDEPLDIVFISNGEHGAQHHYDTLQSVLIDQKAHNRLHRVDGVNGRVAAYQAAARHSHTAWFFAVFAKLQVNSDFDWSWQPDRMQQPKHYIFHAYNPVNHLTYGHQAVIAYNVAMTMSNSGQGLDFTLDQPHEVVPMVSGTAYYDNDPWTCWRTAFRECIKLRHSLPDVDSEYRLDKWLSEGYGVNGHWSMRGAQDAVRYYEEVKGEFDEIKKSYEWAWLAAYAMMVQPELVTQSRT